MYVRDVCIYIYIRLEAVNFVTQGDILCTYLQCIYVHTYVKTKGTVYTLKKHVGESLAYIHVSTNDYLTQ